MFTIAVIKMWKNKWLTMCLLTGFIFAIGMVSMIPLYTDGMIQRMLTKEFEKYQQEYKAYPGILSITENYRLSYDAASRQQVLSKMSEQTADSLQGDMGLPVLMRRLDMISGYMRAESLEGTRRIIGSNLLNIMAASDMKNQVVIENGRMFTTNTDRNVLEVIATANAMKSLDLRLNTVYAVTSSSYKFSEPLYIQVVGIFNIREKNGLYWHERMSEYDDKLFIDESLFFRYFITQNPEMFDRSRWIFAFDYHRIDRNNSGHVAAVTKSLGKELGKFAGATYRTPLLPIIEQCKEKGRQLRIILWVFQIPILLMLAFYIYMISKLIIEHDRNEIAVLKSRGARRKQIFSLYLFQGLLLNLTALLAGPFLGLFLCKVLGASNGFLEFVNRKTLPVFFDFTVYLYALPVCLIPLLSMLIPAWTSSSIAIVEYKRNKARSTGISRWMKVPYDLILLAVSFYILYNFNDRYKALAGTLSDTANIPMDPFIFILSVLFSFGAGLLFVRLHPLLVKLIFWLGKEKWSPGLYATFIHVGRSCGLEKYIMVFLSLTLSIGIFSANAARTVNTNMEERLHYATGADMTLTVDWVSNKPRVLDIATMIKISSGVKMPPVQYVEPPFADYTGIQGAEEVTKVFRKYRASVNGRKLEGLQVMGIIPHEFGRVAWFRSDMLPLHQNEYLNLMTRYPEGILVSKSLYDKLSLKEGDSISIKWGDNENAMTGTVLAAIEYWPAYNPFYQAVKDETPFLIVVNLINIHANMGLEPYEVWIRKKEGATSRLLYKDIEEKNLRVVQVKDAGQRIIEGKNDAFLQGMNGELTINLIISLAISSIGFLIYWILSIKSRVLQFGILRAMGLSSRNVTMMLTVEQILISGSSILVGIVIGGIASDLFIPLLKMLYTLSQQVPPFKSVAFRDDYIKIYCVTSIMLVTVCSILYRMSSAIKINQAVKLGEE